MTQKPESDAIKAQRKLVDDLAAEFERAQQVVRVAGAKLQTAQDKLAEMLKNAK
jgi:exonuclease VII small subunit